MENFSSSALEKQNEELLIMLSQIALKSQELKETIKAEKANEVIPNVSQSFENIELTYLNSSFDKFDQLKNWTNLVANASVEADLNQELVDNLTKINNQIQDNHLNVVILIIKFTLILGTMINLIIFYRKDYIIFGRSKIETRLLGT